MTHEAGGESGFGAAVRDAARSHEPDRYLAALLSPREARKHLIALAAFAGEIARIPDAVRDPLLAEIRLQWWRDAIGGPPGERSGHPVADAFRAVIAALAARERALAGGGVPPPRALPLVLEMLDARADAPRAPPLDAAALETFAARTDGAAFQIAAEVLGAVPSPKVAALCEAAGRAYGLARALAVKGALEGDAGAAAFARASESLFQARMLSAGVPSSVFAAVLPLALVEPYLRAFERRERSGAAAAGIAPLTRAWRIWRAARTGRF